MTSEMGVDTSGEPTRLANAAVSRPTTQPESVVITAEIPAFAPGRPRWTPPTGASAEREARLPAPPALRAVVWLLFVLVLLGLVGLAVEHFHSDWLSFLRNTSAPAKNHPRRAQEAVTSPSSLVRTSSGPHGASYSVPTVSSYELVFTTTGRCFTAVKSPAGGQRYLFASTITSKDNPKTIVVSGSSSLVFDAHAAASLEVRVAGRLVGSFKPPQAFFTYTFVPTGH